MDFINEMSVACESIFDRFRRNGSTMTPMDDAAIDHLKAVIKHKSDNILRHSNIKYVTANTAAEPAPATNPELSLKDRQKILKDLRTIAQKTVEKFIGQYKDFYQFAEFYDYKDADFLRDDGSASSIIPVYYCDLYDFVKANGDDGASKYSIAEPFVLVNSYIDVLMLEYLDKFKMSALVFGETEKDADYGAIDLNVSNAAKYSSYCFRLN